MKTKKRQPVKRKASVSSRVVRSPYEEIITLDECKSILSKFQLSDQRIIEIKNNVIGLVDGVINTYLDSF